MILVRLFCSCSVNCSCGLAGLGCWVAMGGWLLCWCLVGTTQGLGSVVVYVLGIRGVDVWVWIVGKDGGLI